MTSTAQICYKRYRPSTDDSCTLNHIETLVNKGYRRTFPSNMDVAHEVYMYLYEFCIGIAGFVTKIILSFL